MFISPELGPERHRWHIYIFRGNILPCAFCLRSTPSDSEMKKRSHVLTVSSIWVFLSSSPSADITQAHANAALTAHQLWHAIGCMYFGPTVISTEQQTTSVIGKRDEKQSVTVILHKTTHAAWTVKDVNKVSVSFLYQKKKKKKKKKRKLAIIYAVRAYKVCFISVFEFLQERNSLFSVSSFPWNHKMWVLEGALKDIRFIYP